MSDDPRPEPQATPDPTGDVAPGADAAPDAAPGADATDAALRGDAVDACESARLHMLRGDGLPPQDIATMAVIDSTMLKIWGALDELERFRGPRPAFYRVSIFGSSRARPGDAEYCCVRALARDLSAAGCDIVTGGGPGLMQAANEGENLGDPDGRTRSIGVRVELPFEADTNQYVEKGYMHRTFFTRLHQFVRLSSAYVVVGGGLGTLLEAAMIWQLLQVGHLRGAPLVFVGQMWRGLVDWINASMLQGQPTPFIDPGDLTIPVLVDDPHEAAAIIIDHKRRVFDQASRDAGDLP